MIREGLLVLVVVLPSVPVRVLLRLVLHPLRPLQPPICPPVTLRLKCVCSHQRMVCSRTPLPPPWVQVAAYVMRFDTL